MGYGAVPGSKCGEEDNSFSQTQTHALQFCVVTWLLREETQRIKCAHIHMRTHANKRYKRLANTCIPFIYRSKQHVYTVSGCVVTLKYRKLKCVFIAGIFICNSYLTESWNVDDTVIHHLHHLLVCDIQFSRSIRPKLISVLQIHSLNAMYSKDHFI